MNTIAQIADRYITRANFMDKLRHRNGETSDIVVEILRTHKAGVNDTVNFAKHLDGSSHYDTLYNVWAFVKKHIKYVIDPIGYQYIKTPARTWADKYGDCKSFSILEASLLINLGYKNVSYRFVSYTSEPVYTHVYVVCNMPGSSRETILDAVMPAFDKEKSYTHKKDINMTMIYQMSGTSPRAQQVNSRMVRKVGAMADTIRLQNGKILKKKVINLGKRALDQMSEGELDLWLARERMLAEKAIVERIRGIGSLRAERYQDSVDMLEDAIEAVQRATVNGIGDLADPDIENELMDIAHDAVTGVYSIAAQVCGIGSIAGKKQKRKEKKAERKQKRETRKAQRKEIKKTYKGKERRKKMSEWRAEHGTKTGKFLQKVGKKVKQGLKAIAKVLSAPQRLFMKGMLEITLPKASPFFIYLFITDPALIAKLPEKARQKRKKAEDTADFIVNVVGMKRQHFMSIVRTGIMKRMGDSPENIIAKEMKTGVQGIGLLDDVVKILRELIEGIKKLFKKKPKKEVEDIQESDNPNPASEEERSEEVAEEVKNQPQNTLAEEGNAEAENASENYSDGGVQSYSNGGTSIDRGNPAYDGAGGRKVWKSF